MIESEFDTLSNQTFVASAAAKRNVRAKDRLPPGEMAKLIDAARIGGHGERNIGLIKRLAEVADSQRASRESGRMAAVTYSRERTFSRKSSNPESPRTFAW